MSEADLFPPSEFEQAAKNLLYFFIVPVVMCLHCYVLFENGQPGSLVIFDSRFSGSMGVMVFAIFIYGMFVASVVYYIAYLNLLSELKKCKTINESLKVQVQGLENKYKNLQAAASQVLVPYSLDQLVEKNLKEFGSVNFKPGNLLALPKPADTK